MLHRSFKPAKCKTSLKLASSRIKLLKNKKGVQLKQLRRELAQLLESGQDRTARIRVEHAVREEKTIAAYDLLEIYCELIVARLPIIESQKHCPIDLKEAIASVIFASPRCADIPELQDICKQFTAKYGKEFISAAIELRPDCGVGRMLVEKLSAKAPDGQTKIKILSAIAEEHNVKWDPESFEENELKIHGDLLNGPNTFEMAGHDQKHNAHANFEHNAGPSSSSNFSSTDIGSGQPTIPANFHPRMNPSVTGSETTEVRHSHSGDENVFSFGRENWNMEFKDATAAAQAAAESAERASMAARAAAKLSSRTEISRQNSTESQKSGHYNLRDEGPRKNTASKLPSKKYAKDSGSNFQDRNPHIPNAEVDKNEQDNSVVAGRRFDGDVHGSTNRSSQSASLRSSTTVYDNEFVNDLQSAEIYPPNNSSEEELVKTKMNSFHSEMSMNQFSGSNVEFVTAQQSGLQYDNFDSFGEQRINKNASSVFSHTDASSSNRQKFGTDAAEDLFVGIAQGNIHRSTTTESYGSDVEFVTAQQSGLQYDNFDSFGEQRINKNASSVSSHIDVSSSNRQKLGTDAAEDLFVGIAPGNIHRSTATESSSNNAEAVFDDYSSDDDVIVFDEPPKHEWQESKLYSPSAGRESHAHLSVNSDTSSSRQNFIGLEKPLSGSHVSEEWHSPPVFDESSTKSVHPSQPDDLLPPSYDDYENPSSESENESNKSRVDGSSVTSIHSHEENVFFRNSYKDQSKSRNPTGSFLERRDSGFNRNQELHNSSDDNELVEGRAKKNQGTEFSVFDKAPSHQSSSRHSRSQMSSNGITSQPLYDSGYNRDQELHNSLDDEELIEARAKNNGGTEFSVFDKVPSRQSSSRHARSQIASNDVTSQLLHDYQPPPQSSRLSLASEIDASGNGHFPESSDILKADESFDQSSLESGQGLNFGMLSGGLRNKGYRLPPYTKTPSAAASSKKAAENAASAPPEDFSAPQTVKSALNSGISTKEESKPRLRTPVSDDLDTDDSEEEILKQKPRSRREQYGAKERNEMNTKSSIRAPPPSTFLDSRDNDSEDDFPKQTFTSTGRAKGGFSRRTKATPSSGTSSYSKASSAGIEKVPSNSFTRSETAPKPQSQTESSRLHRGSSTDSGAAKQATSKPMPEPIMATHKENRNSPATEQPSTAALKTSDSTGGPKQSTSTGHAPSRESSLNKASHVHPKLPDYDTIAAQLQSLRLNRQ
ncbi:uncharacterized protein LOC127806361 isoform X2 [Diospyros lotus]|uniref:uncharacterized protein LOC127806361 isoform X2 n=1 Tax=Diospyros lotus TaxID=55363 RepID=UPI0022575D69|nr:uncharacterized protein LOC127806361 isoform X2 [Diospyros lotus]